MSNQKAVYPEYITELIMFKGSVHETKKGLSMDDEKWDSMRGEIEESDYRRDVKDWEQCVKKSSGWTKYGRLMYSPYLDKLRLSDIYEFYLNSTVD